MKHIVILGSTGSIGRQTLEIIREFPAHFNVLGLAAWNNTDLLSRQIKEFSPSYVFYNQQVQVPLTDKQAFMPMDEMACLPDAHLIMIGTTGKAGLLPLVQAIKQNKDIAFANKEPLVMAGEYIKKLRQNHSGFFLPVDSEPSAIWQCLESSPSELAHVTITASGGPFRNQSHASLKYVTPQQALKHPTWSMGKRITIDSALLMNKGFEVIESRWLFDISWDKINVVIHPQSIVHSMVTFIDGSVKALLCPPNMRIPIQYALSYPRRLPIVSGKVSDPVDFGTLNFEPLDINNYPCFKLAIYAGKQGQTFPAVLTASDEVAVELFLQNQIKFTDIPKLLETVLAEHTPTSAFSLQSILNADQWARTRTKELANQLN